MVTVIRGTRSSYVGSGTQRKALLKQSPRVSSQERALKITTKSTGQTQGFLGSGGKLYSTEQEAVESTGRTYGGVATATGGTQFGMAPVIEKTEINDLGEIVTRKKVAVGPQGEVLLGTVQKPLAEKSIKLSTLLGKEKFDQLRGQGYTVGEIEAIQQGKVKIGGSLKPGESAREQIEKKFIEKPIREKIDKFEMKGQELQTRGKGLENEISDFEKSVKEFIDKYGDRILTGGEYEQAQKELKNLEKNKSVIETKTNTYNNDIAKYQGFDAPKIQQDIQKFTTTQKQFQELKTKSEAIRDKTFVGSQKIKTAAMALEDYERNLQLAKQNIKEPSPEVRAAGTRVREALGKGEIGTAVGITMGEFNVTKSLSKGDIVGAGIGFAAKEGGGLLVGLPTLIGQEAGKALKTELLFPGTIGPRLGKGVQEQFAFGFPVIQGFAAGIGREASEDPFSFYGGLAIGGYELAKGAGVVSKITKPRLVKGSELIAVRQAGVGTGKQARIAGKGIVLFKETTPLKDFYNKLIPSKVIKKLPAKLKSKVIPSVKSQTIDFDVLIKTRLVGKPGQALSFNKGPIGAPYTTQSFISEGRLSSLLKKQKATIRALEAQQKGSVQGIVRIGGEPRVFKQTFKLGKGKVFDVRTAPRLELLSSDGKIFGVKPKTGYVQSFKSNISVTGDDLFKGSVTAVSKKNITFYKQQFKGSGGEQALFKGAIVKGKPTSPFDFVRIKQVKSTDLGKIRATQKSKVFEYPAFYKETKPFDFKSYFREGAVLKTEKLLKEGKNISSGPLLEKYYKELDFKIIKKGFEQAKKSKNAKLILPKVKDTSLKRYFELSKRVELDEIEKLGGNIRLVKEFSLKDIVKYKKFLQTTAKEKKSLGLTVFVDEFNKKINIVSLKDPYKELSKIQSRLSGKGLKVLEKAKTKTLKPVTIKVTKTPIGIPITKEVTKSLQSVYGPTIRLRARVSPLTFIQTTPAITETFVSTQKQTKALTNLGTKTLTLTTPKTTQKTISLQKVELKTLSLGKTKTGTLTQAKTKTIQDTKTRTLLDTQTKVGVDTKTKTKSLTQTKTQTRTLTSLAQVFPGTTFNLEPIKTKLPLPQIYPEEPLLPKYIDKGRAYNAYIKTTKGWRKATKKPLLENNAWNFGLKAADNTVEQTVTVKPTKKFISGYESPRRDQKFRQKAKSSKISKSPVLVEKRKNAIDTLGEKQGLSLARYLKRYKSGLIL